MDDTTTEPDRSCPACGSNETEHVETGRLPGLTSNGVYEMLSCQDCYAGFKLVHKIVEKELTHQPEVDP